MVLDSGVGAFWSDGSLLFFVDGERGDRLMVLPQAGGPPRVALEGNTTTLPSDVGPARLRATAQAFDGETFSWLLESDTEQSVWSMPLRGAAPARKLAALPPPPAPRTLHTALQLAPLDFGLLVPTEEGELLVIYEKDGAVEALESHGQFLTTDGIRVIWGDRTVAANGNRRLTISEVGKRGVSAPFWHQRLPTYTVGALWPHWPTSGWVVGGWQTFSDGAKHVSMWTLDNTDTGTWLACDPEPIAGEARLDDLISTHDATFLAVSQLGGPSPTWSLIKLRAVPPLP